MGGFDATGALKTEVAQGTAAIQIYSAYFGALPFDHVALTEQTACNYGQSWPMLVYLPICGFWDTTVQNAVGLQALGAGSYWTEVTPHEVAHQWWGQLVGFNSYRDQWMSEGFAHFSVSIFKKDAGKLDDYLEFWKEQQKLLVEKNKEGVRAIDAGPLTMGQRLDNNKAGENIYQAVIYSKGAYVLHMLEMMEYWAKDGNSKGGNEVAFQHSMQQFVKEYSGKAATTEDWKASMERTMPRSLDIDGNGKLDWFFNEWVYGTALPKYTVNSRFMTNNDGTTTAFLKLTQSNVSDDFEMIVPLYLQMADGKMIHFAGLTMHGNATFEQQIPLGKLVGTPKAIVMDAYADILKDPTN
jgi:aminopeptidase N